MPYVTGNSSNRTSLSARLVSAQRAAGPGGDPPARLRLNPAFPWIRHSRISLNACRRGAGHHASPEPSHFSSNLGTVEPTVALFTTRFLQDYRGRGHQAYPQRSTGRKTVLTCASIMAVRLLNATRAPMTTSVCARHQHPRLSGGQGAISRSRDASSLPSATAHDRACSRGPNQAGHRRRRTSWSSSTTRHEHQPQRGSPGLPEPVTSGQHYCAGATARARHQGHCWRPQQGCGEGRHGARRASSASWRCFSRIGLPYRACERPRREHPALPRPRRR
jgi:hypothetical protein